ncbi:hypothetical protein OFM35_27965, partial [Escherichia coli]|nr:hypothetical protein [Escherichia coli]
LKRRESGRAEQIIGCGAVGCRLGVVVTGGRRYVFTDVVVTTALVVDLTTMPLPMWPVTVTDVGKTPASVRLLALSMTAVNIQSRSGKNDECK